MPSPCHDRSPLAPAQRVASKSSPCVPLATQVRVLEEQKEEQEEEEEEEEEEERGGRVEEKGGRGKSWIRYIQEGSKFKSTSFTSSHMCLSGRPHTTS